MSNMEGIGAGQLSAALEVLGLSSSTTDANAEEVRSEAATKACIAVFSAIASDLSVAATKLNLSLATAQMHATLAQIDSFAPLTVVDTKGSRTVINPRTISLIHSIATLYSRSTILTFTRDLDGDSTDTLQAELSEAEVIELLSLVLRGYIIFGHATTKVIRMVEGAQRALADDLTFSALRFLIAHECGHHLASPGYSSKVTGVVNWPKHAYGRADQFAFDLCLAPSLLIADSRERIFSMAIAIAGPFAVFLVERLLREVGNELPGFRRSFWRLFDAIPPQIRIHTMRGWCRQLDATQLLWHADGLDRWMTKLTPQVADRATTW